jgi:Na+/proline symporter
MANVSMAQGVLMFFVSVILVVSVMALPQVGAPARMLESLSNIDPQLVFPTSPNVWLGLGVVALSTGLGPWGMPDMIQRFYGMKSAATANKGRWICVALSLAISLAAYFVGITGHLFFSDIPSYNGATSTDLIVPMIIGYLNPLLGTLFVVLILAASMSTMAAMILSASSTIGIDVIKGCFKPDMSEKNTILLLRLLSVLFLVGVFVIAVHPPDIMLNLISLTIGVISGTFFTPFIYGMYWKKTNKLSVVVGMVVALLISFGGFLLMQFGVIPKANLIGSLGMPFFCVLSIIIPAIIVPLVSLLTQKVSPSHGKEFEKQFANTHISTNFKIRT